MSLLSLEATRTSRAALSLLCCLFLFLYAIYFGAISVLLPHLGRAFGLGSAVQGSLFPAQFAGFVIGVLAAGVLSDRWGRKRILLIGTGIYSLGLVLFGCVSQFGWGLLAAALLGAGSGAMETVVSALVADLYPERRAFMLNGLQVVFGLGAAIGPFLAQSLLSSGVDWRHLYIGLSIINMVFVLVLLPQQTPRTTTADEAIDLSQLLGMLRQPVFIALCLAQACYVGAEVGYASWMPTYFKTLPGGAVWEGLVVTFFWVAMTIGRAIVTPLSSRFSLLRLTIGLALGSACFSLLTLASSQPVVIIFCVLATGVCFSGIFGLLLSETGERYPTVAGSAFGGIVASGGVGGALLPWIMGIVAATSMGWRGALLSIPLASLAVVGIAMQIRRPTNRA